jgi:hypothetical protein
MKQARSSAKSTHHKNGRLRDTRDKGQFIGYMRVSKADGSQVLDLQKDALVAAGVPERNHHVDLPARDS